MTEQQEIISSGNPHEVHLPEGSHTAVHKTAIPMEPQIRNTIVNPDEEVELIAMAQVVSHNATEEARMAHKAAASQEADRVVSVGTSEQADHMVIEGTADQPDHMVSEGATAAEGFAHEDAHPLSHVMSDLPSLDLIATESTPETSVSPSSATQEVPTQADTSKAKEEVAPTPSYMAEMNFPARVVKLKMANDHIRGQIEKLEKPLFAPIPVEAPKPAKGKDKEAAKKPAKGH